MPNIEIHGYGMGAIGATANNFVFSRDGIDKVIALRTKIIELLLKKPFYNDAVVTTVSDRTEDAIGRRQPFLRVYSSNGEELVEVVETLKALNMDIEEMPLIKFHPKIVIPNHS